MSTLLERPREADFSVIKPEVLSLDAPPEPLDRYGQDRWFLNDMGGNDYTNQPPLDLEWRRKMRVRMVAAAIALGASLVAGVGVVEDMGASSDHMAARGAYAAVVHQGQQMEAALADPNGLPGRAVFLGQPHTLRQADGQELQGDVASHRAEVAYRMAGGLALATVLPFLVAAVRRRRSKIMSGLQKAQGAVGSGLRDTFQAVSSLLPRSYVGHHRSPHSTNESQPTVQIG